MHPLLPPAVALSIALVGCGDDRSDEVARALTGRTFDPAPLMGGTDGGYGDPDAEPSDADAGPPLNRVGAPCGSPADCDPALTCEARLPGGYCSRPCDRDTPCPDRARESCVRFSGDIGSFCTLRCQEDADCRPEYTCRQVGDTPLRICYLP